MIAIKEMKMPNSCAECKFCIKQKINDYGSCGRCMVKNGEAVNILNCGLSTNCPLIEIVTCRECKYYRDKGEKYSYCSKRVNVDSITDRYREPNFYCKDAEKKRGGEK